MSNIVLTFSKYGVLAVLAATTRLRAKLSRAELDHPYAAVTVPMTYLAFDQEAHSHEEGSVVSVSTLHKMGIMTSCRV